jgi:hypothetical protein
LSEAIAAAVVQSGAEAVLFPLGLMHVDHQLVAAGALGAAKALPDLDWFTYLDLPYGYEWAEGVPDALDDLADMRPTPVQLSAGSDLARKGAALDFYSSQMAALGVRRVSAMQVERYWALTTALQLESAPDQSGPVDGAFRPVEDAS